MRLAEARAARAARASGFRFSIIFIPRTKKDPT
jgi:hypothetical protein